MAMTVEAISYADLSGLLPLSSNRHEAETWRFVLGTLVGRSTFELLAFSTVTILWLQMALEARSVSNPNKNWKLEACLWILFVVNTMVVVSAMWETVFLIFYSMKQDSAMDHRGKEIAFNNTGHIEDSLQQLTVFEIQELFEGIAWAIHAVIVAVCISLTAKQIHQNLTTFAAPTRRRITLWAKALLPMVVCATCYFLRSLLLIGQFVCYSLHPRKHTAITTRQRLVWWILEEGPTWIAATMLLYSARKPDRRSSQLHSHAEQLRAPLLCTTPAPPPAEVFLAFRQWNQVDSQFFLSPNVQSDAEDDDEHADDEDGNLTLDHTPSVVPTDEETPENV
jgi:hypothetical protein